MNLENCFRALYLQVPNEYHREIETIYKQAKEDPAKNLLALTYAQQQLYKNHDVDPYLVIAGILMGIAISQMSANPVFDAELTRGERDEAMSNRHMN